MVHFFNNLIIDSHFVLALQINSLKTVHFKNCKFDLKTPNKVAFKHCFFQFEKCNLENIDYLNVDNTTTIEINMCYGFQPNKTMSIVAVKNLVITNTSTQTLSNYLQDATCSELKLATIYKSGFVVEIPKSVKKLILSGNNWATKWNTMIRFSEKLHLIVFMKQAILEHVYFDFHVDSLEFTKCFFGSNAKVDVAKVDVAKVGIQIIFDQCKFQDGNVFHNLNSEVKDISFSGILNPFQLDWINFKHLSLNRFAITELPNLKNTVNFKSDFFELKTLFGLEQITTIEGIKLEFASRHDLDLYNLRINGPICKIDKTKLLLSSF